VFRQPGRHSSGSGRTGLAVSGDGVAFARVLASGGRPKLTHCAFQKLAGEDALERVLSRLPHARSRAVAVMSPDGYHLMLVEAPDVPREELRAALRWRIKDLIDFHIDDAVIEVFEMPPPARGAQGKPLYAVAARAKLLRQQIETLEDAGLDLDAVDIPELCLRNIAARIERDGEGIALLYLAGDYGILVLARKGVMYLTRRIDTGVAPLHGVSGLPSELVATLALELRRSLDYFESHYEQTPLMKLYTTGVAEQDRDALADELSIAVATLPLEDVLDLECELSEETRRLCLPAIGAALRSDPVRL
jgi:MSHA biogenesis protein MshI